MKKVFFVCLFYAIFQFSFFATEKLVDYTVGLGSGIPFYGKIEDEFSEFDKISTQNKIVLDTFATINFNVIEQARFFAGVDLFTDLHGKMMNIKTFFIFVFQLDSSFIQILEG